MEENNPRRILLEQRSKEWHDLRAKCIGASDSAAICGLSPWTSAIQLWCEKLGKLPKRETNFAQQKGIRLEPVVLGLVNLNLDRNFIPAVFVHPTIEYVIASLDGLDEDTGEILEIKVGNLKDHAAMKDHKESSPSNIIVPVKYYSQLQHHMMVMGLDYEYYASYYLPKGAPDMSGDLKIVKVHRDEKFIQSYIPILEKFYESLIKETPPEPMEIKV